MLGSLSYLPAHSGYLLTILCERREAGSCDVNLESLREVHTSFSNSARWSDKPEIYRPLQLGISEVRILGASAIRQGLRRLSSPILLGCARICPLKFKFPENFPGLAMPLSHLI